MFENFKAGMVETHGLPSKVFIETLDLPSPQICLGHKKKQAQTHKLPKKLVCTHDVPPFFIFCFPSRPALLLRKIQAMDG